MAEEGVVMNQMVDGATTCMMIHVFMIAMRLHRKRQSSVHFCNVFSLVFLQDPLDKVKAHLNRHQRLDIGAAEAGMIQMIHGVTGTPHVVIQMYFRLHHRPRTDLRTVSLKALFRDLYKDLHKDLLTGRTVAHLADQVGVDRPADQVVVDHHRPDRLQNDGSRHLRGRLGHQTHQVLRDTCGC